LIARASVSAPLPLREPAPRVSTPASKPSSVLTVIDEYCNTIFTAFGVKLLLA